MPTISIRTTDEQYIRIKELAEENHKSVSDFLLGYVFPDSVNTLSLTLNNVIEKAKQNVEVNQEFTLPSLFDFNTWSKLFTKSDKISIGRKFYKAVQEMPLKDEFIFLRKNSANLAVYIRTK